MPEFAVILVYTTSHAIRAEHVLKDAGITVKMIPTPRHLSSDCGFAVRVAWSEGERCRDLLKASGVIVDRIEPL